MATSNSKAENIGRWLGQSWREFARQEDRAAQWMIDRGTSPLAAKSLLWVAKLTAIALVLYAALWIAVLIVAIVLLAILLATVSPGRLRTEEKGQWRDGLDGYGCYRDGVRIDSNRLFEDD